MLRSAIIVELLACLHNHILQMGVEVKSDPNCMLRNVGRNRLYQTRLIKRTYGHGKTSGMVYRCDSWSADASRAEQPEGVRLGKAVGLTVTGIAEKALKVTDHPREMDGLRMCAPEGEH